jgi:FkbM family methyltransferase
MGLLLDSLSAIGRRIGKPPGWERIVRLLVPPSRLRNAADILVTRDGLAFIVQPGVPIGWRVLLFGEYEPELRDLIRAFVPEGGVAADIGANVGWHTLLMAKLVGPEGIVIAAEPNPSVRVRLNFNLQLNRFKHVIVGSHAMAQESGVLTFNAPDSSDAASGDGHVPTVGETSGHVITVEKKSVDQWIAELQIDRLDFVKIDVEGYEWPVFQGAIKTFQRCRPVIVFEWNAEYAVRGGGSEKLMKEYFASLRYELFTIGRSGAHAIHGKPWPKCVDIIAIPVPMEK